MKQSLQKSLGFFLAFLFSVAVLIPVGVDDAKGDNSSVYTQNAPFVFVYYGQEKPEDMSQEEWDALVAAEIAAAEQAAVAQEQREQGEQTEAVSAITQVTEPPVDVAVELFIAEAPAAKSEEQTETMDIYSLESEIMPVQEVPTEKATPEKQSEPSAELPPVSTSVELPALSIEPVPTALAEENLPLEAPPETSPIPSAEPAPEVPVVESPSPFPEASPSVSPAPSVEPTPEVPVVESPVPVRSIEINSDLSCVVSHGQTVSLWAVLSGFDGEDIHIQWQRSSNGGEWYDVSGANGLSYSYQANEDTIGCLWRLAVTVLPKE